MNAVLESDFKIPDYLSVEAADFCRQLLIKNVSIILSNEYV